MLGTPLQGAGTHSESPQPQRQLTALSAPCLPELIADLAQPQSEKGSEEYVKEVSRRDPSRPTGAGCGAGEARGCRLRAASPPSSPSCCSTSWASWCARPSGSSSSSWCRWWDAASAAAAAAGSAGAACTRSRAGGWRAGAGRSTAPCCCSLPSCCECEGWEGGGGVGRGAAGPGSCHCLQEQLPARQDKEREEAEAVGSWSCGAELFFPHVPFPRASPWGSCASVSLQQKGPGLGHVPLGLFFCWL